MHFIETEFAPNAAGHYSQGIMAEEGKRLIFTSMQLPMTDESEDTHDRPIEEQVAIAVKNVVDIIRSGGGNQFTVIKMTIYTTDPSLWDQINDAYSDAIGTHKPARTFIGISHLPKGYKVAIEGVGQTL
jgi:2-iminobutanoate/2-iminopropanoate deaminase